jgi:hypothetical protein
VFSILCVHLGGSEVVCEVVRPDTTVEWVVPVLGCDPEGTRRLEKARDNQNEECLRIIAGEYEGHRPCLSVAACQHWAAE